MKDSVAFGFTLPPGLLGRFGVIKLWPDIQVAEDELIARLINTANLLGLECIVLDHLGRSAQNNGRAMTNDDLDFVIHLHFSTPKSYDIFSFVTLWNPPQFFHDFGYQPMVENLLTHDDWLSCRSPGADQHIRRLTHDDPFHLASTFDLFHSLADPILPPSLGDLRIFYMGINWERLGRRPSRHQAVLDLLDETGLLRIFGPEELRGVKVWDGFRSYQRSLPFDGVSVIEEIHRAGICLALSSQPHKEAALMSSRLFEGLAAGALIICDENPWALTHFGETLLYVDLRDSADTVAKRILEHVEWARQNAAEALALATKAQDIFRQRFTMDASLAKIYTGLQARKADLAALCVARMGKSTVQVVFLLPDPYDDAVFERQEASARDQLRQGFESVILVDHHDVAAIRAKCAARPGPVVAVRGAAFFQHTNSNSVARQTLLGSILKEVFNSAPPQTLLCFVQPNENVFSNHVALLAAALGSDQTADYAWSKVILLTKDAQNEPRCVVAPTLDLLSRDPAAPLGPGRFMFRADRCRLALDLLLQNLDIRAASGLAIYAVGRPTGRASVLSDMTGYSGVEIDNDVEVRRVLNDKISRDLQTIRDVGITRFDALDAHQLLRDQIDEANRLVRVQIFEANHLLRDQVNQMTSDLHAQLVQLRKQAVLAPEVLYLDRLSRDNRRALMFQLLQSLPLPIFVWRVIGCLRRLARSVIQAISGLRD